MRSPRAVSQIAPGRLRVTARPALRPVSAERGALEERMQRVTPVAAVFEETRELELSQFSLRAAGECRGGAPKGEACSDERVAVLSQRARSGWCASRRSASLLIREDLGRASYRLNNNSDANRIARTILHVVIAGLDPAIHAELPFALSSVVVPEIQYGPPGQARW